MRKLSVLALIMALVFALGAVDLAVAKAFPKKPVTIICPWSAGGGTDRTARFIAEKLGKELGVRVNVINKTGGGGAVGFTAGAKAKADGYTITNLTFEVGTLKWMGYSETTPADFRPPDAVQRRRLRRYRR